MSITHTQISKFYSAATTITPDTGSFKKQSVKLPYSDIFITSVSAATSETYHADFSFCGYETDYSTTYTASRKKFAIAAIQHAIFWS